MPKITKLFLHLFKLYRKNRGFFFPDTVYSLCTALVNAGSTEADSEIMGPTSSHQSGRNTKSKNETTSTTTKAQISGWSDKITSTTTDPCRYAKAPTPAARYSAVDPATAGVRRLQQLVPDLIMSGYVRYVLQLGPRDHISKGPHRLEISETNSTDN